MYPSTEMREDYGNPNVRSIFFERNEICRLTRSDDGYFYLDIGSFGHRQGLLSQEFLDTVVHFMKDANRDISESHREYFENEKANRNGSDTISEDTPF